MIALLLLVSEMMRSTPTPGVAEETCRPQESGPAIMVAVRGLKDRMGTSSATTSPRPSPAFLDSGRQARRTLVRTMDDHFSSLFALYEELSGSTRLAA